MEALEVANHILDSIVHFMIVIMLCILLWRQK